MSRLPTASTGRVDLCTPADFLERVRHVLGRIELDPASNPGSLVGAELALVDPAREAEFGELPEGFVYADGLDVDWGEAGNVFFNPPYARGLNGRWAEKAGVEGSKIPRLPILGLVPVATSERWWGPYWGAEHLAFLVGRLRHVGEKHGAPFAQAVVGWNLDPIQFHEAFHEVARIRVHLSGPGLEKARQVWQV